MSPLPPLVSFSYASRPQSLEDELRHLRHQVAALESSNQQQNSVIQHLHTVIEDLESTNKELELENEKLKLLNHELSTTLNQYVSSTTSHRPVFSLNYSSPLGSPSPTTSSSSSSRRQRFQPSPTSRRRGRKPHHEKPLRADRVMTIYPPDVSPQSCTICYEKFVWRLIGTKAQYIHYKIYTHPDSNTVPTVPGVRNRRCEYGLEFLIMLAHHVYWLGLSLDKACELINFYTGVTLPKSQADKLLYQLSHDWSLEYSELAEMITRASIIYIDETGWKIGKKSCYTWVFGTIAAIYYCCGVGRGQDVLQEVLGDHFFGTGVTDDYAVYDYFFDHHQLCWAHFLRKAAELMLRNPMNSSYRQFYVRLLSLYRQAKRYQHDQRLSVGRAAKVQELQRKVLALCQRYSEEIVTESKAKKNGDDPSQITSESEAKMIRLQKELVEKLECLFVFVEHPEVESTNNRSERNLRHEAIARKNSKISKSKNGAERRGIIMSVLGTIKQRLNDFSLKNILKLVKKSYQKGVSLFAILKPPNNKSSLSQ
jgi:hypothetical protein